ncbi:MAG: hypothetical protein ER33_05810 [Cyanobium sp. CACIAM 14]|nr:MAG: hypothetical protein ER33_05810 [Cyanobium sp. CACIAM 14]
MAGLACAGQRISGAGFLQIPAQRSDLGAQLGRTLLITPRQSDGKGELQFLELVTSLLKGVTAPLALGRRAGGARDAVLVNGA